MTLKLPRVNAKQQRSLRNVDMPKGKGNTPAGIDRKKRVQVLSFHLCFTQNRYNKNDSFESKIDLNLKSIDLKKTC